MRAICIEGLDAVGKETVSKALEKSLIDKGYRVKRVSFPNYESSIGKAIKDILLGECGNAPALDPELISPFYTMDRISYFKCNIDHLMHEYDYIIMDRSYYSNVMYQAAKYYISGRDSSMNTIYDKDQIKKYGMTQKTIMRIFDWMSKNYIWEIFETKLCQCDSIYTFILSMRDEDNKKQLATRDVLDTNELNDYYLAGCREFVTLLLSKEYNLNIKKFIKNTMKYIEHRPHNQLYINEVLQYYLDNVERIEVTHADNPDDIPKAVSDTVEKIIKSMIYNDMIYLKGR